MTVALMVIEFNFYIFKMQNVRATAFQQNNTIIYIFPMGLIDVNGSQERVRLLVWFTLSVFYFQLFYRHFGSLTLIQ